MLLAHVDTTSLPTATDDARPGPASRVDASEHPLPQVEARPAFVVGVVEDSDEDYAVLSRSLRRELGWARVRRWARAEAVLDGMDDGSFGPPDRPDVLVVDLSLPGIDGCELVRRIRATGHLAGLPLFMFSGSGRTQDVERCTDAGADAYFRKSGHPADMSALLDRLALSAAA